MSNPRTPARARSAAPSDRRAPAASDRSAPASGDRRSGRPHNGSETPSRHRASRPAGPSGAFSVGAFSSGAQSTGPLTTGTMPAISRPSSSRPADRLNRQAPAPVSALSTGRNEGRRRRQRGAESTLPTSRSAGPAIAAAMEELLQDGENRRRLGSAARRRAEEAFDIYAAVENLLLHYRAVVEA